MDRLLYLSIEHIHPHPRNPRKDLGDLSELAESIRTNGIMQNLTVVPQLPGKGYCPSCSLYIPGNATCRDGHHKNTRPPCPEWQDKKHYTVIIGHRRLAAAKLAGLVEIPCIVADLTEKEQAATMLLENMQRSDLTVLEEADGIQLMLDMGCTQDEVSKETGLSKQTIVKRTRLLQYDHDKVKAALERGGTLADYAELEKIKDQGLREKVLDHIGTNNFKWEMDKAISKEREIENKVLLPKLLDTFALRINSTADAGCDTIYYQYISFNTRLDTIKKPNDAGEKQYFYIESSTYCAVYKEREPYPAPPPDPEREAKDKLRAELGDLREKCHKSRMDFVLAFNSKKYQYLKIMEFAVRSCMCEDAEIGYGNDKYLIADIGGSGEISDFNAALRDDPGRSLLIATMYIIGDNDRAGYHDWDCAYEENADLDMVYEHLIALGYEPSDEELRYKHGEHELLVKPGTGRKSLAI